MNTPRDDETSAARAGMGPTMRAVAGVAAALRSFGLEDGLASLGFTRRRRPLASIALFGAGVALGAAVGLLVTPRSGSETRRALRERFNELRKKTDYALLKAEYEIEEKTGDLSGKVEEGVKVVERKIGDEIEAAAEAVKASLEQAKAAVHGESGGSGSKDREEGSRRT